MQKFSLYTRLRLEALESRDVPAAIIPPPGLVSWWPGDGDAIDIVGGNNGALQNGAGHYQGYVADGFNFDGQDGLLQAPTNGLPTGSADRTVALWVKINQQTTQEAFFASYGDPGSAYEVYTLGRLSNHHLFLSTWGPAVSGPVIDDGQWYFVTASNVGNAFRLYLDGVSVASGTMGVYTPAGSTFWMGRETPGTIGDSRRLNGMVDEVSVFNRALSDAEILSIYQAGRDGMLKPYMVVNDSTPSEGDSVTTAPTAFEVDFSHPVDPTSLQASDFAVNGFAASSYTIIDTDTIRFQYTSSPVTMLGVQTMSMSAGSALASDNPADPSLRAWSKSFTYASTVQVGSTVVNNGEIQRSRVTSLTVTFNTQVAFAGTVADAFTMTRSSDGAAVSFTGTASTIGGVTVVALNGFNGSTTQFGSLADGRYTLTALASQISASGQALDGNGDGTTGDNYIFGDAQGLFRLFGDVNGDQTVNGFDLGFFRNAFGTATGDSNYLSYLDYNGDGVINGFDLGQFRTRFGTVLP